MMITTAAIGGMATVISNTMAYDAAMTTLLNLNISPYLCAFLVVGGICVITCDGIVGMQVFLSAMAERFMSIPASTWALYTVSSSPPPAPLILCRTPPVHICTAPYLATA